MTQVGCLQVSTYSERYASMHSMGAISLSNRDDLTVSSIGKQAIHRPITCTQARHACCVLKPGLQLPPAVCGSWYKQLMAFSLQPSAKMHYCGLQRVA